MPTSSTNKLVKFLALICGSGFLLLLLIFPIGTTAAFTKQINYQGKLTNASASAVPDASYSIVFTIYDAPTSGNVVWTETDSVTTTGGLFSLMLGSVSSLESVNFNQALYLSLNVNGDGEMTPRKTIGAVASALEAGRLDGNASSTAVDISGYLNVTGNTSLATTTIGSPGTLSATASLSNPILKIGGLTYSSTSISAGSWVDVDGEDTVTAIGGNFNQVNVHAPTSSTTAQSNFYGNVNTATFYNTLDIDSGISNLFNSSISEGANLTGSLKNVYSQLVNTGTMTGNVYNNYGHFLNYGNVTGNAYNLAIENQRLSGTISGDYYALYLGGVDGMGATNNYSIYSTNGKNYFGGTLEVTGRATTSSDLYVGGDLTVNSGKGITLGGVYRTTWPTSGTGSTAGSFWATSSDSLVGYPDLIGNYAIVIGAAATTSGDTDSSMRLKVAGNTKLAGTLTVTGNATTSGYSSLATTSVTGFLTVSDYASVSNYVNVATGGYYKYNNANLAYGSTTINDYFFGNAGNLTMTGGNNTAIGNIALAGLTTGVSNTALGSSAGNISRGSYNLFLGDHADLLTSASTSNNAIAIGYNAQVGGSNMLALGGTSANAVLVGIGTSTPNAFLDIYGSSTANDLFRLATSTNQNIVFINKDGNIGMGMTPTEKLDVTGNIQINANSIYKYNGANLAYGSTTKNNYFFGGAGNLTMTGAQNTATGYLALSNNSGGYNNTANGYLALSSNNNGYYNTAIGSQALNLLNGGIYNTAVGASALSANITGENNTALGASAGATSIGSNNLFLGYLADTPSSASTSNNAIAIGYNAQVGGSNMLALGGAGADAVMVGVGTSTPNAYLNIYGSSAANNLLRIATSTNQNILLVDNNGRVNLSNDLIMTGSTANIRLGSNWLSGDGGDEGVFVDSSGNVGIGSTGTGAKLTIGNNIATSFLNNYSEYQVLLYDTGFATTSYGLGVKAAYMVFNSGGGYSFDRSGATSSMIIDSSGNVGIETSSPDHLLTVEDTSNTRELVRFGTAARPYILTISSTSLVSMNIDPNTLPTIISGTANSFIFASASTTKGAFGMFYQPVPTTGGGWSAGISFAESATSSWSIGKKTSMGTNVNRIYSATNSDALTFSFSDNNFGEYGGTETLKISSTSAIQIPNGSLCVDNDRDCYGTTNGYVYADNFVPNAADVAENYQAFEDNLSTGDIVAVSNLNTATTSTETFGIRKAEDQNNIIGIVSTQPGVQLGYDEKNPNQTPVALSGRVPVKVNLDGGPIAVGDKITLSSVAGVGAKATSSGQTVGIALEAFDSSSHQDNGVGKIMIFVNLSYAHLSSQVVQGNISSNSPWSLDEITGQIRAFGTLNLGGFDVTNVRAITSASGNWSISDSGELLVKGAKISDSLEIGSAEKRIGITLYDEQTGEPYCVSVNGGNLKNTPGKCSATMMSDPTPPSDPGNDPGQVAGTSTDNGATSTSDVSEPTPSVEPTPLPEPVTEPAVEPNTVIPSP